MATDFYSFLGFTSNPFENNSAEREPEIASYAVRPPYLDRVLKTSPEKGIFVLTGSRGSGKSATRLTVSQEHAKSSNRLVVPLIGFNVFKPYAKGLIPLDLFANQIAFLTIEQILSRLSALPDDLAANRLASLKNEDRVFVAKMVGNFYLNRSEHARNASATECFETLDVTLKDKSFLWAGKKWDQLSNAVATFATKLGEKYFEFDIGNPATYAELLKRQKADGFSDPIYIFSKIVELARCFGFTSITIQIDKVDETDWTTNSVVATGDLVYPLLANIQLHEIDGLTWTFFLWDKVKDILTEDNARPVRWDKIPEGEISWSREYLDMLVNSRLKHFSNQRINSLNEICDDSVDVAKTTDELITLANNSPRSLVTLLDVVLAEHNQANQHAYRKLSHDSFEAGMDVFTTKSLGQSGNTHNAKQISKVKSLKFSTSEVASRFGIGSQAARSKIDSWVKLGLLEFEESLVGSGGGRPVDYFKVTDAQILRFINRNL